MASLISVGTRACQKALTSGQAQVLARMVWSSGADTEEGRAHRGGQMEKLAKKEQSDRSKINMHDPIEVKYWTKELGVSIEQLHKVAEKVGNSAATVRKELEIIERQ